MWRHWMCCWTFPGLMWPLLERWQQEFACTGRRVLDAGRPTIAMQTFVRLMVLKQRHRWGYRTLLAEVSDSIHLRRFCRIALSERVPDESTVRKLVVRIGPETVTEICRAMIETAVREKRFRPRAVRIDSTVVEADVKYPTDAGLASSGVRVLAREGRKLAALVGEKKLRVRDRSRSMGRKLRAITRTIRRRSGEAKSEVLSLTEQTGDLLTHLADDELLEAVARVEAGMGLRGAGVGARDERPGARCDGPLAAGELQPRAGAEHVLGDLPEESSVAAGDPQLGLAAA